VSDKGKGHMAVALSILIEFFCLAVMMFKRLADGNALAGFDDRHTERAGRINNLVVFNGEANRFDVVLCSHMFKQSLSNESTCTINCATAHPRLT
jgi:hypothetical protein